MIETQTEKLLEKTVAAGPASMLTAAVAESLTKQFQATLLMLKESVELCPDNLWARESDKNKSWQIAYHALFFTHYYSQPKSDPYIPWSGQHAASQNDDGIGGAPDPESELPFVPQAYSKAEVLEYWQFCWDNIEQWIAALDLASSESGFWWYPIPKLEHLLVNLRHTAHHTGQLAERVRTTSNLGVPWRGTWPPRKPVPPTL